MIHCNIQSPPQLNHHTNEFHWTS